MSVRKATALGYDREKDQAPRILAAGRGDAADRLLEIAAQHGIPVHEDKALVEILLKLDVGCEIPPELYQVVAEILILVKYLEDRARDTANE